MPESGESIAATQRSAGSSARACSPSSQYVRTPFAAARAWIAWSAGISSGSVATISLPVRWCGTLCAAQNA